MGKVTGRLLQTTGYTIPVPVNEFPQVQVAIYSLQHIVHSLLSRCLLGVEIESEIHSVLFI